ncbi:Rv3654c family TadE-like protein [Flexivirga meconopsidis]|uniref:Rv3654c family TadE-like protein n=1 Tax=Flexivirga meconopsidis TaxID=2977121 RepID=UPI00223F52A6
MSVEPGVVPSTARAACRPGDRGSATVLVIAAIGVVLTCLLGALALLSAVTASHRARAVADLAALAGAGVLLDPLDARSACAVAASVASANRGHLTSCAESGDEVTVSVTVTPSWPGLPAANARARAGPEGFVPRSPRAGFGGTSGLAGRFVRMSEPTTFELSGHAGRLHAQRWPEPEQRRYVALLCHGYGEHIGRYGFVADRLRADGAIVYGLDHVGHGRSEGERVLIDDFDKVVDDFRLLHKQAEAENPDLPVVLIGHSMGGMIAARYGGLHGAELACLVLSAPVLGHWDVIDGLLSGEIEPTPLDPSTLSRDPAVGAAYEADPLVWHGPFKRSTLQAFHTELDRINKGPALDDVTAIWLHGKADQLVPYAATQEGWRVIADEGDHAQSYPGARHEIFNEINKLDVLRDVTRFINQFV